MRCRKFALLLIAVALIPLGSIRAESARELTDVVYATIGDKKLALDLYLPAGKKSLPLIVWVHGGAWYMYDKKQYPKALVESGFALASLDFRQSTEARFPAQIYDIKAAIRFLRANAKRFGYRADRIAIAGASSGGHLAALAGVTNGDKELEGSEGDCLNDSSDVQAIVDYFGASNLTTILAQSTPFGLGVRKPALDKLLGAQPDEVPQLAQLASPVFHVSAKSPPLMLLHGDQDPQMPINQAHELQGAYEKFGRDVELDVVHGAAHAGPMFYEPQHLKRVVKFLHRTIGE
jgi:acetyl esterase/lipase